MSKMDLKSLLRSFKEWVAIHPERVTDVENIFTWTTYITAGKVSKSPIMSEAVYSLVKLLGLFNDETIRDAYTLGRLRLDTQKKIKLILTAIDYTKVLYELLLNWSLGEKAKWAGIVVLSLLKTTLRLILLGKYGLTPIASPPIPALNRAQFVKQRMSGAPDEPQCIKTHTGRLIRSIHGAPDIETRDWEPVTTPKKANPNDLKIKMYAELIHTMRPVAHLCCLWATSNKSWVPWAVSLGLDLVSLNMFGQVSVMTTDEQTIIKQRYASILLYLFRTPMYNKYTKAVTMFFFLVLSKKIPCFKYLICEPIMHYLQYWQHIYFYMWT